MQVTKPLTTATTIIYTHNARLREKKIEIENSGVSNNDEIYLAVKNDISVCDQAISILFKNIKALQKSSTIEEKIQYRENMVEYCNQAKESVLFTDSRGVFDKSIDIISSGLMLSKKIINSDNCQVK